jgi:hypothetical protein
MKQIVYQTQKPVTQAPNVNRASNKTEKKKPLRDSFRGFF